MLIRQGDSFRHVLFSGEWLANVGIPLIIAIVAIVVANRILRAQLRNDVALMRAEREVAIIREFALTVVQETRNLQEEPSNDLWWREARWPGWDVIQQAHHHAGLLIKDPDILNDLMAQARDVLYAWIACQERRARIEKDGYTFQPFKLAYAIYATLEDRMLELQSKAEDMLRWDGVSVRPNPSWPSTHVPSHRLSNRDKIERWKSYFANQFEALAKKH